MADSKPTAPAAGWVPPVLGIIAGNRSLPILLAQQARAAGVPKIVAIAFQGETDPDMVKVVDDIVWLKVGQLGELIENFKIRGVRHCVMAGQIAPKNLFDVRPDWRAVKLLWRLKEKNAHTIFGGIADELAKDGIELIDAVSWLKPLMPAAGFHLGPRLTEDQSSDITFGYRLAKEVSRLEIGQTVVVKNGTVLAVEGFEGTDKCLARGGELAGKSGGAVAVKVAKEKHDMRFDIPCVGPQTIEACGTHGVAVLALEPQRTLVLEQAQVEALAKKLHVTIVTVDVR
jgi:UDP-2,3-diacylglucosamine hydrolase